MMNSHAIIGREKEIELFEKIYNSGRSEFVAVYGRLTHREDLSSKRTIQR